MDALGDMKTILILAAAILGIGTLRIMETNRPVIACVGDSITQGYPEELGGYPAMIPNTVNLGVIGATTHDMLSQAVPSNAKTVILMGGTNNFLHEGGPSTGVADITQMVSGWRALGDRVFVLAIPVCSQIAESDRQAYNSSIMSVAIQYGCFWVDPGLTLDDLVDGIHPTQDGYAKIAHALVVRMDTP